MPKRLEEFGLSFLYPDNWSSSEDPASEAITIESPEGAFLSITRLENHHTPDASLAHAQAAMEHEYEEIEHEPLVKHLAGQRLTGVTQRFVYLDLIVTSHLLTISGPDCAYLVQIQAEDRDMTRLDQVFDAVLTSICQSFA